jgi:hypothetical protein
MPVVTEFVTLRFVTHSIGLRDIRLERDPRRPF